MDLRDSGLESSWRTQSLIWCFNLFNLFLKKEEVVAGISIWCQLLTTRAEKPSNFSQALKKRKGEGPKSITTDFRRSECSEKHMSNAKAESPCHTSRCSFDNRNLSSWLNLEPQLPIQVNFFALKASSKKRATSMKQLKSIDLLRLKVMPSLSSIHLTTLKSPIKHHHDWVDSLRLKSES